KGGKLVGGVGVAGDGHSATDITPEIIAAPDTDDAIALAGQIGYAPSETILGSHVTIDGIRLPYIASEIQAGPATPFGSIGANVPTFPVTAGPGPILYPALRLGGANGEVRIPIVPDPSGFPLPTGAARLSASEV